MNKKESEYFYKIFKDEIYPLIYNRYCYIRNVSFDSLENAYYMIYYHQFEKVSKKEYLSHTRNGFYDMWECHPELDEFCVHEQEVSRIIFDCKSYRLKRKK